MVAFTGWRGDRQQQHGFCTASWEARWFNSGLSQRHPHEGAQNNVPIQYRSVALERSVIPLLKKQGSFILQQWMADEKESAYHTTPFLKYLIDGHSSHPNLNQINRPGTQAFFSYFSSALFSIRNPALLAPIYSRESILPYYHHEPFASPKRPWMWPSV